MIPVTFLNRRSSPSRVFSCHSACSPVVVSGCRRSCIGCMVGQQRTSVECVSFCLFMVHGLEETKGWRRSAGQTVDLCLYIPSTKEKGPDISI